MADQYIVDGALTDEALLELPLLRRCAIDTSTPRTVPKGNLNIRDADSFDYMTRSMRIGYPGCQPSITMMIPNVVIHYETFNLFGKTGVYVGVPQEWAQYVKGKLGSQKLHCNFEDQLVTSDEKYWWTRCGFEVAQAEQEYIFIVNEDQDGYAEDAYPDFPSLFGHLGSAIVANVTCGVNLTAKIPVAKHGSLDGTEEWRAKLNITRVNVVDLTDVDRPRAITMQKSVAGKKDVVRGALAAKLKQLNIR
jgi:hypothetical protein